LFENPYVDAEAAEKTVNNARMQARAALALRKSVVLLRNRRLLPLKPQTKVYMEIYHQPFAPTAPPGGQAFMPSGTDYPVTFVRTPEAADVVLLWLQPTGRPLFASDGSPLYLSLSKAAVNVEYVKQLMAKKPTVLAINYSSPWVVSEVYSDKAPGNTQGVLATFGTTPEALLDVVTGRFKPTGRMPFTTPISEEAVLKQKEDVPGYLEGPAYPLFKYGEGLGY
jgi:beta-glucosidase